MARRLPLVAALAGLTVIAVVLAVVLTRERVPVTGGNNEFVGGPQFAIDPGGEACQPGEVVPPGTAAVRLHVGASGHPAALRVRVRSADRVLATGETRWNGVPQDVTFELDRRVPRETRGEVCVRNVGAVPVAMWAWGRTSDSAYTEAGPLGQRIRTEYLGGAPETRAATADVTVRRMATARGSLLDGWAPWGALAAALGLVAVVLVAARRELAP